MVGPSLSHTAFLFQENVHKKPSSNAVIVIVDEEFRGSGHNGNANQVDQLLSVQMKTMEESCSKCYSYQKEVQSEHV